MVTGFSQPVRELVMLRCGARCERCGQFLFGVSSSIHHRRRRGMGGVSGARADVSNSPANALVLCGSATTGCHGWAEANPTRAHDEGIVLRQDENPAAMPVELYVGRVLLTDDGMYEHVEAA
jgi:hypothetical protein